MVPGLKAGAEVIFLPSEVEELLPPRKEDRPKQKRAPKAKRAPVEAVPVAAPEVPEKRNAPTRSVRTKRT
jgi:hypothetical protein